MTSIRCAAALAAVAIFTLASISPVQSAEPAFTDDAVGKEARKIWEGAQTGDLEMQGGMAVLYWGGLGVPKAPCKALSLARKSGAKGYVPSQAMVVMLYLVRSCGEHDHDRFARAYGWFTDDALEWMEKNDFGENLEIGPDNELGITTLAGFRSYLRDRLSRSDIQRALHWRKKLEEKN